MRLEKLDILRGVAILLMVIFHINYSLLNIFNISTLNISETFWFIEGRFSALLFIFIAGFSFLLAEKRYEKKINIKYIKISTFLGIISSLISLSTFYFFPEQYIRFGIIHFFTVSFLLILIFRHLRSFNVLFGILFIIYGFYFIPVIQNQYFYFLGFTYSGFSSADFYPIFPYFGVMLLGYSFALFLDNINELNIFKLKKERNMIYILFEYMGKKSLIIYLIHQPIIIGVIYIINKYIFP